jgi:beta-phosphoglucomutase-like phosphatase (HAD superfamily)
VNARATIIAFDGVLADTLPLRAAAVAEGCDACGVTLPIVEAPAPPLPSTHSLARIEAAVAGLTLEECVTALLQDHDAIQRDPTLRALASLHAERAYTARLQRGVPLLPRGHALIHTPPDAAMRLVLRADSTRAQVEPVLRAAGLLDVFAVIRCADDGAGDHRPSIERSWRALDARLSRIGIPVPGRVAREASVKTARIASQWAASVSPMPEDHP